MLKDSLKTPCKVRYRYKISFINAVYLFLSTYGSGVSESESCPRSDSFDLVSYLVLKTSCLMLDQLGLTRYWKPTTGLCLVGLGKPGMLRISILLLVE